MNSTDFQPLLTEELTWGNRSEENGTIQPALSGSTILFVENISKTTKIAFLGIFASIVIVGFIGNVFIVKVVNLYRPMHQRTTNYLLVNLAVADLLMLTVCSPPLVVELYLDNTWCLGEIPCKSVTFLENLSTISSLLTILLIAYERRRLLSSSSRTAMANSSYSRHIMRYLYLLWLLAAALSAPSVLIPELRAKNLYVPSTPIKESTLAERHTSGLNDGAEVGEKELVCLVSPNKLWMMFYLLFLDIFLYVVPLVGMTFVYGSIVQKLYRSLKRERQRVECRLQRSGSDANTGRFSTEGNPHHSTTLANALNTNAEQTQFQAEEEDADAALGNIPREQNCELRNAINLIIAITVVYFACLLPFRILRICYSFGFYIRDQNVLFYVLQLVRLPYYLNNSGNFIVYIITSEKFYLAVKDYIATWCFCLCTDLPFADSCGDSWGEPDEQRSTQRRAGGEGDGQLANNTASGTQNLDGARLNTPTDDADHGRRQRNSISRT